MRKFFVRKGLENSQLQHCFALSRLTGARSMLYCEHEKMLSYLMYLWIESFLWMLLEFFNWLRSWVLTMWRLTRFEGTYSPPGDTCLLRRNTHRLKETSLFSSIQKKCQQDRSLQSMRYIKFLQRWGNEQGSCCLRMPQFNRWWALCVEIEDAPKNRYPVKFCQSWDRIESFCALWRWPRFSSAPRRGHPPGIRL